MTRNYTDYINDILDSINEIEEFIEGMSFDSFQDDKKTSNAVIRSLEVMGEAVTKLPDSIRDKYPNIPWKRITGMRNKLIHGYFGVDLEIVWTVCTEEIPPLKPFLRELLASLDEEDSSTSDDVLIENEEDKKE